MRNYRCFIAPEAIHGNRAMLSPQETHYLQHVLRLQVGDRFELCDGQGNTFPAILRGGQPLAEVEILTEEVSPRQGESPLHLILALALIKGDRFEWAVQKGTELGVNAFIPLLCRHGEVRPGSPEMSAHKLARWEKIARSAANQCRRSVVPEIHPVVEFAELAAWIKNEPSREKGAIQAGWHGQTPPECRVALLEQGGRSLDLLRSMPKPTNALLLIGPEGGWDQMEEAFLGEVCFPLSLGPRVLRSETAAITAAVLLQSLWGDFTAP